MTTRAPVRNRREARAAGKREAVSFSARHRDGVQPLWPGLALLAVTLVLYLPSYSAGFIWDDDAMVTENPLIKASDGLWRLWFSTEAPDYFPLVSTLLWTEWRLFGNNPAGYHIVQALLHGGAAVLLWRVLERLRVPGAWWAALIFAVHPVNVETVSWITETKNTLPMVLYLASALCYLRFEDGGGRRFYAGSVGLFLLALLGKTSVVMLPPVLLLLAWWRRGRIGRVDLLCSVPFFSLSLVLGLVTVWFQSHRAIVNTVIREDGFASRLAVAGRAVWFYLAKALMPVDLSFVYPRWSVSPASVAAWIPLAALGIVAGVALWKRQGWGRHLLAGFGYYVLSLLPVLGFVNIYFMRYSLVADHWQYVAMPGVIALAVGAVAWAVRGLPRHQAAVGAAAAAAVLFVLSWNQQQIYASNERLFTDVLDKNPGAWIAHNNLGLVYAHRGELEKAAGHYVKALELKPGLADAHLNLGNVYAAQKRDGEAVASYLKSLGLAENFRTRDALGEAYLRQGKVAEARAEFARAVQLQPNFARAHANLAEVSARENNWPEAVRAGQEAVRLAPARPEFSSTLARALMSSGRPDEAVAELRRGLAARPDYVPGYINLAKILSRQGRRDQAASVLQEGLRFQPGHPELQAELARLAR